MSVRPWVWCSWLCKETYWPVMATSFPSTSVGARQRWSSFLWIATEYDFYDRKCYVKILALQCFKFVFVIVVSCVVFVSYFHLNIFMKYLWNSGGFWAAGGLGWGGRGWRCVGGSAVHHWSLWFTGRPSWVASQLYPSPGDFHGLVCWLLLVLHKSQWTSSNYTFVSVLQKGKWRSGAWQKGHVLCVCWHGPGTSWPPSGH